jgi:transaldolase
MLFVDTADRHAIARWARFPGVTGFTTNPTLMARTSGAEKLKARDYVAAALDLCALANDTETVSDFMIQGFGSPAQIMEQAQAYLRAVAEPAAKRLWLKLPPTRDALSCCPALDELGCKTLVTAVFTPAQAFVAMQAGADGVAVYVGRMIKALDDWQAPLRAIADIVGGAGGTTLLASFPDLATVERALPYSAALTVPPPVLESMLSSDLSASALADFNARVGA